MRIAISDRHKLAFRTRLGTFQYCVAPLGPCNMPAEFNARMHSIFGHFRHVKRYFDDFNCARVEGESSFTNQPDIPFDPNFLQPHYTIDPADYKDPVILQLWEDHLFLEHCHKNNVIVSPEKTKLCRATQVIVGHEVSYHHITLSDKTLQTIERLQRPRHVKDLMMFMGTVNYCSKFIKNFATIVLPLSTLLTKDAPWTWSAAQDTAYLELKHIIASKPVLRPAIRAGLPDHMPFVIFTDASNHTIAAILAQQTNSDDIDSAQPCQFFSRKMIPAETNYTATEREGLAVIAALLKFRYFLTDAIKITVITDHKALEYLLSLKDGSSRMMRWILLCQQFPSLVIKHRSGSLMSHVDSLTRLPTDHDSHIPNCPI